VNLNQTTEERSDWNYFSSS